MLKKHKMTTSHKASHRIFSFDFMSWIELEFIFNWFFFSSVYECVFCVLSIFYLRFSICHSFFFFWFLSLLSFCFPSIESIEMLIYSNEYYNRSRNNRIRCFVAVWVVNDWQNKREKGDWNGKKTGRELKLSLTDVPKS